MSDPVKETVIVVHGTWAEPIDGVAQWYARSNGSFVEQLNAALEARDSNARCWAHCDETHGIFHWSGENSWVARTHAAESLVEYVDQLWKDGWLCHIVAHSHGGNIAAEALPAMLTASEKNGFLGRLVTLGTPFIDVVTPAIEKEKQRQDNVLRIALVLCSFQICRLVYAWALSEPVSYSFLSAFLLVLIAFRWRELHVSRVPLPSYFRANWGALAFEVFVWVSAGILLWAALYTPYDSRTFSGIASSALFALLFIWSRRRKHHGPAETLLPAGSAKLTDAKRLLALGSTSDEAWQVLHHMGAMENPLSVNIPFSKYLTAAIRSSFAERQTADRLYYGSVGKPGYMEIVFALGLYAFFATWAWQGHYPDLLGLTGVEVASAINSEPTTIDVLFGTALTLIIMAVLMLGDKFLGALLLPFRWLDRIGGAFASVIVAIGVYIVRRASWLIILKIAMGLEGYRFAVPTVRQSPANLKELVSYENMPTDAQGLALQSRNAWISRHLEAVSETFSKLTVTPVDVSSLLQKIEADQTLVHAAYYTNIDCIKRIADWIAKGR